MLRERLSGIDAGFLQVEHDGAHMHIAGLLRFAGDPPAYADVLQAVERRLHLVPRYRQKLQFVPFGVNLPVWIDDVDFDLRYHIRSLALPRPGSDAQLKRLVGDILSQPLDRTRPLWEMWLIEGLRGGGCALVSKMHHCLADGIASVNVATVILDTEPSPSDDGAPAPTWRARPTPSAMRVLADAVSDRLTAPITLGRALLAQLQEPLPLAGRARSLLAGLGEFLASGLRPAPASAYNVATGGHRRFTWVPVSLAEVKAVKDALGGSVNDVVMAAVSGALRRHLARRQEDVAGLTLKAMIPVNVREDAEQDSMGNRISTLFAPLPVELDSPADRLHAVTRAMRDLKAGDQVRGAQLLADVLEAVSPTLVTMVVKLLAMPRTFNLTVTNIPGPQMPLYFLGRELKEIVPIVPLAAKHAVGIAAFSYNGRLCFGLLGDYGAMTDIEELAEDLRASLAELSDAVGAARRRQRAEEKAIELPGKAVPKPVLVGKGRDTGPEA